MVVCPESEFEFAGEADGASRPRDGEAAVVIHGIPVQAVEDVLAPLGAALTEESLTLFKEFEEGSSVEARFVRAIDKIDMLITAAEYEKTGFAGLSDFWHNNATFKPLEEFPELAKYAEHLRLTRERRVSGHHDQHS